MLVELMVEIAPGHELVGLVERVEAFFEASDDVIARLVDASCARVRPTWSHKAERPSWPTTDRLGRGSEASAAVAERESSW
ncbi:MAG: hypothetical protein ACRYG2_33220 [Janthinobacterium lividum]